MHATPLPAASAPAPINRPTVTLTERGAQVLALSRCRDSLPASTASVISAAIDRRIASVLADA